jgi:LysM repeat protein
MHSQLVSRTASCNKGGFGAIVSTPYTLTPTTTIATSYIPTSRCVSTYTVQPGEKCPEIAAVYGVSTFSILTMNGFTLNCEALVAGSTLCLGQPAKLTHFPISTGVAEATCDNVIAANPGLTVTDLLLWNSYVSGTYQNLYNVRAQCCVSGKEMFNCVFCLDLIADLIRPPGG